MDELLEDGGGVTPDDMKAMRLGLSHSLSRYKLKFSADKVDTMIVQAIGLLDELDKVSLTGFFPSTPICVTLFTTALDPSEVAACHSSCALYCVL